MVKLSIYVCLALSGIISAYTIDNQEASQVLFAERKGLIDQWITRGSEEVEFIDKWIGRSMRKCLNKVCNYEEFAERSENMYRK